MFSPSNTQKLRLTAEFRYTSKTDFINTDYNGEIKESESNTAEKTTEFSFSAYIFPLRAITLHSCV